MDATSDPANLNEMTCQLLVNFLADRRGVLRGQIGLSDITLSAFGAVIDGLGFLNSQIVQFSNSSTSNSPLPARLVVAANGTLYTYPIITPLTYPPTFNVGSVTTQTGLVPGKRVRMAPFGQEMVIVQDGNAYASYRMQYSGTLTQLGLNTPLGYSVAYSYTLAAPGGPVNKLGNVQYLMTTVDNLGRESSPSGAVTIAFGGAPATVPTLHAINPYTDPQVAGVRFYATLAGGSLFYRIADLVSPNTDFQDNLADSTVQGGINAPAIGENNKPKPATLVATHKNRVFLDQTDTEGLLQASNFGSSTQFNPSFRYDSAGNLSNPTNGITLQVTGGQGDRLTGIASFGSLLAIASQRGIHMLYGSDLTDFNVVPVQGKGCIAKDTFTRCDNVILYLADDGVYALLGNLEVEYIGLPIQTYIDTLRATPSGYGQMEAASAWFVNNEYCLSIGTTTFVMNFRTKEWTLRQLGTTLAPAVVVKQPGLAQFALVGRADTNKVTLIDTLTSGQSVTGLVYRSRPMVSNLPYHLRSTMGDQESRAARKRVPRVRVSGAGTLSGTNTITLNVDGRSETYPIKTPTGQDGIQGWLCAQGFSAAMTGRLIDVQLNLSGVGVSVSDIEMDYVFVG